MFFALCGAGPAAGFNFGLPQTTSIGEGPRLVVPIHLNDDGRIDFVAITYSGSQPTDPIPSLIPLTQSTSGVLTVGTPIPAGMDVSAPRATVADLTGDRLDDLVLSGVAAGAGGVPLGRIVLYPRQAGGGLGAPRILANFAAGGATPPIAAGDLTGDGALDLVYWDPVITGLHLLVGDGAGNFTEAGEGSTPWVVDFRVADIDANGRNELVVAGLNDVQVIRPTAVAGGRFSFSGSYTVAPQPVRPGNTPTVNAVAAADVNRDSFLDVVVSVGESGTGGVQVFPGRSDGLLRPTPDLFDAGELPELTRSLADLNGDGYRDLSMNRAGVPGGLGVAPGLDSGGFGLALGLPIPASGAPIAVDINGDGRTDLAYWSTTGFPNTISYVVNTSVYPPPLAETTAATNIAKRSLTLNGRATTRLQAGSYLFQYGITPALGSATAPAAIGEGRFSQVASATLDGLAPGGTYYYRLVVTTPFGTTPGQIQQVRTGGLIDAASFTPRWQFGRPTGTLTLTGLPKTAGRLKVEVKLPGKKAAALRRTNVAFTGGQARLRIPLRSAPLRPGAVRVIVTGRDDEGTRLTQELVVRLKAPASGWANAYFTRQEGSAFLGSSVRRPVTLRVNYDFDGSLPKKRTTRFYNSCRASGVRFLTEQARRIGRDNTLGITMNVGGRTFTPGIYTCVLRANTRNGFPVARVTIRVRR